MDKDLKNILKLFCDMRDKIETQQRIIDEFSIKERQLHPCALFVDDTPYEFIKKLREELAEVEDAERAYCASAGMPKQEVIEYSHLCEELVDLQTVCETFLTSLKADIEFYRTLVFDKNQKRGYFRREVPGDD